jgi:hypothetical protein
MMEDTRQGTDAFDRPESPKEAKERLASLRTQVQNIQRKMSNRGTSSNSTQTATATRWHDITLQTLIEGKRELEYLEEWLRRHRIQKTAETLDVDLNDPDDVIRVANTLIQALKTEGRVDLTKFESDMVDLIRFHALNEGTSAS